jgi:hypothetical protein
MVPRETEIDGAASASVVGADDVAELAVASGVVSMIVVVLALQAARTAAAARNIVGGRCRPILVRGITATR